MSKPQRVLLVVVVAFFGGHFVGRAVWSGRTANAPSVGSNDSPGPNPESKEEIRPIYQSAANLLARSKNATMEELSALLEEALAIDKKDAGMREFLVSQLVARAASLDPLAALDWYVRSMPEEESARHQAERALFGAWGRSDPVAAIEAGKAGDHFGALDAVLRAHATRDPEKFLELATRYRQQWRRANSTNQWVFEAAFETLGRSSPTSLAAWMSGDQPASVSQAAARATAAVLVESNGAAAYDLLAAIEQPNLRNLALERAANLLVESDVTAATKFLEKALVDKLDTESMRYRVVDAKQLEDPFAAAAWLRSLTEDGLLEKDDSRLRGMIPYPKTSDVATLLRFAGENGADMPGFGVYNLLANTGSMKGAGLATLANDLLNHPQDTMRDEMLVTLIRQWHYGNTDAARSFAATIEEAPLRRAVQKEILNSVGQTATGVVELAESLQWEGALPREALRVLATGAPESAIDHIAKLDESAAPSAAAVVAAVFANRDPEAGKDWINRLPSEATKVRAAEVFAKTLTYDSQFLSQWAASLQPGSVLDAVAVQLVRQIAENEPDAAFAWAQAISENELRAASLDRSLKEWVAIDPEAALTAVQTTEKVTRQERAQLLQQLSQSLEN